MTIKPAHQKARRPVRSNVLYHALRCKAHLCRKSAEFYSVLPELIKKPALYFSRKSKAGTGISPAGYKKSGTGKVSISKIRKKKSLKILVFVDYNEKI